MTRPPVSVVMPFAGTVAQAHQALDSLLALDRREGDELILADNSVTAPAAPGVSVVPAAGERSPAHARNVGAEHASGDWILFLDADCRPHQGLLDAYFTVPVESRVGALAGAVLPAPCGPGGRTLAAQYGTARNFLSLDAHLTHPYRPRAVAANLLVRRAAFAELGGFFEGLRAAEDTDFSWRLQEAGWLLEGRPTARVEHHYRASVAELRRQWRGYAAGRAWLARRYAGFAPEPAFLRAVRRLVARPGGGPGGGTPAAPRILAHEGRGVFLALDALLALEELVGFALSNRPARDPRPPAALILVADRFPARGDALIDRARAFPGARVEAARRPDVIDQPAAREVPIDYQEDDGSGARVWALTQLAIRHPVRCARGRGEKRDYMGAFSPRPPGEPSLAALAPAVLRLARDPGARVRVLDPGEVSATARRLAALAGASLVLEGS